MRHGPRSARRAVRGALAALVLAGGLVLTAFSSAAAQHPTVDPRALALTTADLPRGFAVVESQTELAPLRMTPDALDAVGLTFRTTLERPQTLENLQSGPIRISQLIAWSDDPTRATFSLDAQREFNVGQQGFEMQACPAEAADLLCLARHDGPLIEFRIVVVRGADTLVSTTAAGLPSAVNLDGAVALAHVSMARHDALAAGQAIAERPPAASGAGVDADLRAVATPTPPSPTASPTAMPPSPTPTPPTAAPMPGSTPTAQPAPPSQPDRPSQAGQAAQPVRTAKLPARVDERLAQPWAELMSLTATTRAGEKLSDILRRTVESTDVTVVVSDLRPNVGGELRVVAKVDGDDLDVIESEITINKDVMNESPRVIATILAHEIDHARQPVSRSSGEVEHCMRSEAQAYAMQAEVWSAFWGSGPRPTQTKWERSMNYVEEIWRDQGESGLRKMVGPGSQTGSHACQE